MCAPASIGWSALILWTITVYGVLAILSVFTACVHRSQPTAPGARILRILSLLDLGTAALAPLHIYGILHAPNLAILATVLMLSLAALCRQAARRPIPAEVPRARVVR